MDFKKFYNQNIEVLNEADNIRKTFPFDIIKLPRSVTIVDNSPVKEFNGKKYLPYVSLDADYFYVEVQIKETDDRLKAEVKGEFKPGGWAYLADAIEVIGIDEESLKGIVITKPKYKKNLQKFLEQRRVYLELEHLRFRKDI